MDKHWNAEAVTLWSCSESNWTWPEQPALNRVGQMICRAPVQLQLFCDFVNMKKIWGLSNTARKPKGLILLHILIMFEAFFVISNQAKLWNITFWSSKHFRLTKPASLYSYTTQYVDLANYFHTWSLKTLMTCIMYHHISIYYLALQTLQLEFVHPVLKAWFRPLIFKT